MTLSYRIKDKEFQLIKDFLPITHLTHVNYDKWWHHEEV